MSEHSFFVFDPVSTNENISSKPRALVEEWNKNIIDFDNSLMLPLNQWAYHSFVNENERPELPLNTAIGQFKSHNSSMVLRTAELPIYTSIPPDDVEYETVTVGYLVSMPERLSKRQIGWLALVDAPTTNNTRLFTLKEYQLLKHLKVISAVHSVEPINLYQLDSKYLADAIKSEMSDVELILASVRPSTTKALLKHYTWWIESLSVTDKDASPYYLTHAKAHKELILRNERINQLNAIIYTHYYTDTTAFLGDTHKISPEFISKVELKSIESLSFCIYGYDGWYEVAYPRNKLTIALVAMATVGYWATDCNESDSTELLTTTIESFVLAHQANNSNSSKLYEAIYQPQNPFDLRADLLKHNGLMPVLAMVCSYPIKTSYKLASYFDGSNDDSLVQSILDENVSNKDLVELLITKLMYIN